MGAKSGRVRCGYCRRVLVASVVLPRPTKAEQAILSDPAAPGKGAVLFRVHHPRSRHHHAERDQVADLDHDSAYCAKCHRTFMRKPGEFGSQQLVARELGQDLYLRENDRTPADYLD